MMAPSDQEVEHDPGHHEQSNAGVAHCHSSQECRQVYRHRIDTWQCRPSAMYTSLVYAPPEAKAAASKELETMLAGSRFTAGEE